MTGWAAANSAAAARTSTIGRAVSTPLLESASQGGQRAESRDGLCGQGRGRRRV